MGAAAALLQAARQAHAALEDAWDNLEREASDSASAYGRGSPYRDHDREVERIRQRMADAMAALEQAGAKPEEGEGNG